MLKCLLQFLFENLLINRLAPFFDSPKFLITILSSFVNILSHKCRQLTMTSFMTLL